jgi:hypothetical protein
MLDEDRHIRFISMLYCMRDYGNMSKLRARNNIDMNQIEKSEKKT